MPPLRKVTFIKRDTRHPAQRKLTWFRAGKEINWFHPERERLEIIRSVERCFPMARRHYT